MRSVQFIKKKLNYISQRSYVILAKNIWFIAVVLVKPQTIYISKRFTGGKKIAENAVKGKGGAKEIPKIASDSNNKNETASSQQSNVSTRLSAENIIQETPPADVYSYANPTASSNSSTPSQRTRHEFNKNQQSMVEATNTNEQKYKDITPQPIVVNSNPPVSNNNNIPSTPPTTPQTSVTESHPPISPSSQPINAASPSNLPPSYGAGHAARANVNMTTPYNVIAAPLNDVPLPPRPTPDTLYPLRITDGREYEHTTTQSAIPEPSSQQLSALELPPPAMPNSSSEKTLSEDSSCEELLAVAQGLMPTTAAIASDPKKTQEEFQKFKVLHEARVKAISEPTVTPKLQLLAEYGLIRLEDSKPTKNFYDYYEKMSSSKEVVSITPKELLEINSNFSPEVGFLKIDELKETALLSGPQSHVVAVYNTVEGKKVVWGYFTSQKAPENVLLSDYQPFGDGQKQPQYFHPMKKPLIVSASYIQDQSQTNAEDTTDVIRQEAIEKGNKYVVQSEIYDKLKSTFEQKTIPLLATPLTTYEGVGITVPEIDGVLEAFQKHQEALAQIAFDKKYVSKLHEGSDELKDWLDKKKQNTPHQYPYLLELANEYNEKHGRSKRYEIPKKTL